MGGGRTSEDRRRHAAETRDLARRGHLKSALEQALLAGPDVLAALQRESGHELIRLNLLHSRLRFLDAAGVPADRLVLLPQPAPVIDLHDAGTAELLDAVDARLRDEHSLPQTEREALTQIVLRVLKRLGELPGRTAPKEKGRPTQ